MAAINVPAFQNHFRYQGGYFYAEDRVFWRYTWLKKNNYHYCIADVCREGLRLGDRSRFASAVAAQCKSKECLFYLWFFFKSRPYRESNASQTMYAPDGLPDLGHPRSGNSWKWNAVIKNDRYKRNKVTTKGLVWIEIQSNDHITNSQCVSKCSINENGNSLRQVNALKYLLHW